MQAVVTSVLVGAMRLLTGIRAQWIGCDPLTHARIYFANHSSHLDGLVIWASLPKSIRNLTRPVAARDYWTHSAIRRYFAQKIFNALLIEREGGRAAYESLQEMMNAIGNGNSLIFFPEGTRGDGHNIGTFKSGLYHLAKSHPETELVPVYLQNLSRVLPKGEILPVPLLGSATFGKPIHFDVSESRANFLDRARAAIERLRISET